MIPLFSDYSSFSKLRTTMRATVLFLVALISFTGCASQEEEAPVVEALPAAVTVAEVTRSDISSTLSYIGTVQSESRVDLVPQVGARIDAVLVDVGDSVEKGAVLARLETNVLEAQVKQAEANLLSARANLNKILGGARPEEIAAARAQLEAQRERLAGMAIGRAERIAAAEAAVASAHARLADLRLQPKAPDLQSAQATVDSAQASLADAEAKLFRLLRPTQEDVETQEAAVAAARVALQSAEANLEDLKARPKPAELKAAETLVAAAKATLQLAKAKLDTLTRPLSDEKVDDIIQARIKLLLAWDKLREDEARGASQEQLDQDNRDIIRALREVDRVEEELNWPALGIKAEDMLAAQREVDSATASLRSAEANLEETAAGPTVAELEAARSATEQARSTWVAARTALLELKTPNSTNIQAARSRVDQAKATLSSAQATLQKLNDGPTTADFQTAEAAVAQAQSDLDLARTPSSPQEINSQAQLVAEAESRLGLVENLYTRNDINTATAQVAVAEATVQLAKLQLSEASIKAPFDAIIEAKHLSAGAIASPQTPVFSLVSRDTEVIFNVEEAALGSITPGLSASMAVPSYPGQEFLGQVSSIAPTADPASRTFVVKVIPDDPDDLLLSGMFASLSITIEKKAGVLSIPKDAVVQSGGRPIAFVVADDRAQARELTLGLTSGASVEVVGGLAEGELVVVKGNKSIKDGDLLRIVGR